jgi:hypothetical protein
MPSREAPCYRCGGWTYSEFGDRWCLLCGEHIKPPDFKPLPFVIFNDDRIGDDEWFIDDNGDIIDHIDQKIEALIETSPHATYNVSYVAKAVHCSNYEARMTLDRLVRIGELEVFTYGPQSRWTAYRKAQHA